MQASYLSINQKDPIGIWEVVLCQYSPIIPNAKITPKKIRQAQLGDFAAQHLAEVAAKQFAKETNRHYVNPIEGGVSYIKMSKGPNNSQWMPLLILCNVIYTSRICSSQDEALELGAQLGIQFVYHRGAPFIPVTVEEAQAPKSNL